MSDLRIVFMGTPEFAVPSLQILVENGFQVVGVITAPDKPKGRGQKIIPSPVKEYAESQGLRILQPTNLKAPDFLDELRSLEANLQVVVAFRMLPEVVWAMPEKGTFNLHASLLPQYRGAAPINWAIINGEKETGVTTFFLKHEIDTGAVIFQEREAIAPDDTVGSLYTRLMQKGSWLVLRTAQAIAAGTAPSQPQNESLSLQHAPKIFRETCQINWDQPAQQVYNFIRGLSPYPAAWTMLQGKVLKIYTATLSGKPATEHQSGNWLSDGKNFLAFKAADELVYINELQLEGKKRMETEEFLRGFQI